MTDESGPINFYLKEIGLKCCFYYVFPLHWPGKDAAEDKGHSPYPQILKSMDKTRAGVHKWHTTPSTEMILAIMIRTR